MNNVIRHSMHTTVRALMTGRFLAPGLVLALALTATSASAGTSGSDPKCGLFKKQWNVACVAGCNGQVQQSLTSSGSCKNTPGQATVQCSANCAPTPQANYFSSATHNITCQGNGCQSTNVNTGNGFGGPRCYGSGCDRASGKTAASGTVTWDYDYDDAAGAAIITLTKGTFVATNDGAFKDLTVTVWRPDDDDDTAVTPDKIISRGTMHLRYGVANYSGFLSASDFTVARVPAPTGGLASTQLSFSTITKTIPLSPSDVGTFRVLVENEDGFDGSPMCTRIRRGVSGAVADAQIASSPDATRKISGADLAMITGTVGAGPSQSLIRFDLSDIPVGVTIDSSTMVLTSRPDAQARTPGMIKAHQVNVGWNEATASWARFYGAPAPQFDPKVAASSRVGSGAHSFDLTALVGAWMIGGNNGLLLEQDGASSSSFYTSEDPDQTLRPELEVCFTP